MGLLDGVMGDSFDDPKTMGLLALAANLSSGQRFMPALSQGLLARQQIISSAAKEKQAQEMQGLLMQQHQMALQQAQQQQAAQQRQQQFLQGLQSPQQTAVQGALSGGGGPTMANAAKMPAVDPQQEMIFNAVKAGAMPIDSYIASMRKDTAPIKLGAGESLYDPKTLKPLATNPKDEDPAELKAYKFAQSQGYPGTYQQFVLEQKRAGATNVTLSTEKGYGEKVAGGMAERDLAAIDAARSAPDAIASAQRIKSILSTQKPITGAGADARLAISKALYTAGLTKGDDVVATENLQRELSQGVLQHIKSSGLGGGSGFSNADRDFLEKAAAGTIGVNALTLARTAELAEKAGRKSIDLGNAALKRVQSAPGLSTIPLGPAIDQPGNIIDFGSLK